MRLLIASTLHFCVTLIRPLAAVLTGLLWVNSAASAPDYPARPVRVVVAFTAGDTTDILARSVSQQLAERLKQPFLIDNRPGGGGNIGTENVVRAAPDGYTLLVGSVGPIAINQTLFKNLSYGPLKDLVPVVQIADVPNVLMVHPSVPTKTFEEFLAYVKANLGKLDYGSTGVGTSSHLSSFMLSQRLSVETLYVPYKGANALNDLLAGRLQFMFAPKGTPASVIVMLNKNVNDILPQLEAQMIREGADPVGGSAAHYGQFTQKEFIKWKAIVESSGAVAE
jgi:tripartite-type tricarboxylate transporter receptor subunit TctC